MSEQPNGNVLRERVENLRHRLKNAETAFQFISEMGAKSNEQIKVHDEQFREQARRIEALEDTVKDVPVLHERVDTVIEGVRAARNALYAAAGAFLVLAATVIWQASQ